MEIIKKLKVKDILEGLSDLPLETEVLELKLIDKKLYGKELSELKKIYLKLILAVDPALFTQEEEKVLFEALKKVKSDVEIFLKNHQYEEALLSLSTLDDPAKNFFDNVKMKVDNISLRNNRFALKNELLKTFHLVADFSKIQD